MASLRLRDPHGSDPGRRDARLIGLRGLPRAIAVIAAATIIAAATPTPVAAAGRSSSQPRPTQHSGHRFANLRLLWSAYPLGPRASSHERAVRRSRPPSSQPSKASARDQRRHQPGSSLAWLVAAGVGTAVLLVLVSWQTRRGFALRKVGRQPSSRSVVDGGSEDGIAPAADRGDQSTDSRRAPHAPTDSRRSAVDWPHDDHLLFVPTSTGYLLAARPGDAPPVLFEFDGKDFGLDGRFRVSRIGASPLPSDDRDCAYLERT
jgi:hypothetical protein